MPADPLFAPDIRTEPWWWQAAPRPPAHRPDDLPERTDVVVVGSGFTGLSAALHLARAGREVLVLEAAVPGHGASSRNAGFVGRTLKHGFGTLLEHQGLDRALRTYGEMREAYELVFELVESEQMSCHLRRSGRFMGALSPAQYEGMARELELRRRHLGEAFEMIPRGEQSREIGSERYHGGALIPEMGSIHPGLFHLELLRRTQNAGAKVIGDTAVLGMRRAGGRPDAGHEVCTAWGVIQARDVVVATNGYTGPATPWLRRRVVPFQGFMIATEPLAPERLDELLPNDRTFHDYANNLTYIRRAPDEPRLLMGGLTGPPAVLEDKAAALYRRLTEVFPQLDGVRLSRVWTGACAGTFDLWPHTGIRDGVHYALGYCFAGLPMGTYLGKKIAARLTGQGEAGTVFAERQFPSRPYYFGRPWFLGLFMRWYDYQDRKAAGSDPGRSRQSSS